jgi:hypothetical protein
VLSTLHRLDAPLQTLCPSAPSGHKRPQVLAILGASSARAVHRRWGSAVGECPANRRELARPSAPALRPALLLPLAVVLVMVCSPVFYLALIVHRGVAPPLARALINPLTSASPLGGN